MKTLYSEELLARYRRAETLEQGAFSKSIAFNTTVYPHWVGESHCFWYKRETRDGQVFRKVDAKASTNEDAFDHNLLAIALTQASGEDVQADNLPLDNLDLLQAPETICFEAFGKHWAYSSATQTCKQIEALPAGWKQSPDGKKALFSRDYNLWLYDLESGEEKALTDDGEPFRRYAPALTVYGHDEAPLLDLLWSADFCRIAAHLIDIYSISTIVPSAQCVPNPYRDFERVGVAEFGPQPHALAGLLVHPQFYRVDVSNNPMIDSQILCAMNHETEPSPFERLVGRLQGKLLLIACMLDDVIPASITFRVVETLQKANKNFVCYCSQYWAYSPWLFPAPQLGLSVTSSTP
ncbi:DPP IV N-terminal domain-containing protein [Oceanicoccus sagamiensis]|uniref:Dipeptidylpeptidase IV N-terminal domain-containing protein n=1 Tax=Oceanicoccus sagamiensis TaxID=716816 RepID=A0A1X9N6U5_9GAMM|nr:DPP IV N-terminal domain-containing protein [Oceanicoccus sagamiensis]ARN73818.1 hypothetical protein BST96_06640 [Oceanicoccus sagamiensis]